jgi:PEP-CTERM motif
MTWKKMAVIGIPVLALALSASGGARADNLVTNGGFETNTGNGQLGFNTTASGWSVPNPNTGGSYAFVYNTSAGSSGTSADNGGANGQDGNVGLWGPGNGSANGLTVSPTGGAFVALDSNFQVGALSQTINGLTKGDQYSVSFYWAGAQQSGFTGATTDQLTVGFGSAPTQTTATVSVASQGFSGWIQQTFTFTAESTSDVLSFLASGTPANSEPPFALLDGVSVNAVPEPSTALIAGLSLLAFGAFGAVRKNRRAKSAGV